MYVQWVNTHIDLYTVATSFFFTVTANLNLTYEALRQRYDSTLLEFEKIKLKYIRKLLPMLYTSSTFFYEYYIPQTRGLWLFEFEAYLHPNGQNLNALKATCMWEMKAIYIEPASNFILFWFIFFVVPINCSIAFPCHNMAT